MSSNLPRHRRPSERSDDRELWRRVTHDVAPLQGRAAPPSDRGRLTRPRPSANAAGTAAAPTKPSVASHSPPRSEPALDSLAGIDRANAERLKRGRHPVEARLDLHGLTQSEAH